MATIAEVVTDFEISHFFRGRASNITAILRLSWLSEFPPLSLFLLFARGLLPDCRRDTFVVSLTSNTV
jgi:hypothetical protein